MIKNKQEFYFHFEKKKTQRQCTFLDPQGQFPTYVDHLLIRLALCENNLTDWEPLSTSSNCRLL